MEHKKTLRIDTLEPYSFCDLENYSVQKNLHKNFKNLSKYPKFENLIIHSHFDLELPLPYT